MNLSLYAGTSLPPDETRIVKHNGRVFHILRGKGMVGRVIAGELYGVALCGAWSFAWRTPPQNDTDTMHGCGRCHDVARRLADARKGA